MQTKEMRFLQHFLGGDAAMLELAPYLVVANDGKAPEGLKPTDYPEADKTNAAQHRLGWVTSARWLDWEEVTVPAGSYRALRYELTGQRDQQSLVPNRSTTMRFKVTMWYAPDVQRIVKAEHQTWGHGADPFSDDSIELIEYRPPR